MHAGAREQLQHCIISRHAKRPLSPCRPVSRNLCSTAASGITDATNRPGHMMHRRQRSTRSSHPYYMPPEQHLKRTSIAHCRPRPKWGPATAGNAGHVHTCRYAPGPPKPPVVPRRTVPARPVHALRHHPQRHTPPPGTGLPHSPAVATRIPPPPQRHPLAVPHHPPAAGL